MGNVVRKNADVGGPEDGTTRERETTQGNNKQKQYKMNVWDGMISSLWDPFRSWLPLNSSVWLRQPCHRRIYQIKLIMSMYAMYGNSQTHTHAHTHTHNLWMRVLITCMRVTPLTNTQLHCPCVWWCGKSVLVHVSTKISHWESLFIS